MGDETERAKFADAADAMLYAVRILGQVRRDEREAQVRQQESKPRETKKIEFRTLTKSKREVESVRELAESVRELASQWPGEPPNEPPWLKSTPGKYQIADLYRAVDLISFGLECEGAHDVGHGFIAFAFSREKVDAWHNANIAAAWAQRKRLPLDRQEWMNANFELREDEEGRLGIAPRDMPT